MVEPTRLAKKRERTRQTLIDAATQLVDERDHERISIQDITDKADVGLGTFYNYFDNKQMVFEAALDQIRQRFEIRLDALRSSLTDPASRIAATLQFCFMEALDNEEWKVFLAKSGLEGEHLLLQDPAQCLADIETGAKRGRFKIDNPAFVANLIYGMARHITIEIAADRLNRGAIPDTTRYVLRMLGLPELVAKAITQTPLPPVAAQQRRVLKEILPHLQPSHGG
ncbi:MAG: AcrR family transcriptional regulator [Candidatus Azotimanducaceae bacterium]